MRARYLLYAAVYVKLEDHEHSWHQDASMFMLLYTGISRREVQHEVFLHFHTGNARKQQLVDLTRHCCNDSRQSVGAGTAVRPGFMSL